MQISLCTDEAKLPKLMQQRDARTEAIGKLRKDLKNAKVVMERSGVVMEKINSLHNKKQERIGEK